MNPSTSDKDSSRHSFVVHWLNNKEMHFTQEAERIMEDLFRLYRDREDLNVLEMEMGQESNRDGESAGGGDSGSAGSPMKLPSRYAQMS